MKPIVIIGAVAAGMSAASQIKRELPEQEVIVFGKEEYISYGACGMPYYVSGELASHEKLLVLSKEKAVEKRNINVKTLHEVTGINRDKKKVSVKNLETGESFEQEFEKLILAMGAEPIVPPLEGIDQEGIFPLNELQDSINISKFIEREKPKKAVVIGGGFIGIEVAESFTRRGMEVTLVEAARRILGVLDEEMSELVHKHMEEKGVKIIAHDKVIGFEGDGKVKKVKLSSGEELEADIVLVSIGVTPRNRLAREVGLEMGERNAILTDRYQQTSCPDIYAAGDCSTVYHALLEKNIYIPLALSANRQGRMCGENIAAELNGRKPKPFPGIIGTSMTKVFDYEIGKTGIGDMECRQYQLKHVDSVFIKYVAKAGYYPKRSRIWVKLFFEAHSKKIVGAQIVGQDGSVLRLDVIVAAITAGLRLDDLYNMDMGYMPAFSPVWDPLLIAARAGMKEE